MDGRRVYPNEKGELRLAECDYGYSPQAGEWQARPPGCNLGSLKDHDVTEHEDGTITVSPSIVVCDEYPGAIEWHGYLEHGVWRQA